MIKNIDDLKKCQIVCRNDKDIEDCLNMLEELGFEVRNNDSQYQVIFYRQYGNLFENDVRLECGVDTYFYNKKFIKTLQKFIKQKEGKEKEKQADFEVAEDGRIIKINNYKSREKVFIACEWDYRGRTSWDTIEDFKPEFLDYLLKYGLAFSTKEARDKAMFKLEIETKLKNIAERLNNSRKIDWKDKDQNKYEIYYDYMRKKIECRSFCYCKDQGIIYCLDKNFLNVAKKEISEENLIKYFKE